MATGQVLFHRFYCKKSFARFNVKVCLSSSISILTFYLNEKIEELSNLHLRDIALCCFMIKYTNCICCYRTHVLKFSTINLYVYMYVYVDSCLLITSFAHNL